MIFSLDYKKLRGELPKIFLAEGDDEYKELEMIATPSFLRVIGAELVSFMGDSGVTMRSVPNGDLLSEDDEDEPIHWYRLKIKNKKRLYRERVFFFLIERRMICEETEGTI